MWLKSKRVAGFTLLECLVALLILSGSVLVFQGLTLLVHQEVQGASHQASKDWLLFQDQFRSELDGVRFDKVAQDRLFVTKGKQSLAFGLSSSGDFRKTDASGKGYQPMLYQIRKLVLSEQDGLLHFRFTFESGQEREFFYAFETGS